MDVLFPQFLGLAGLAALIAILINVGKAVGLIKEGQAVIYSTLLNLVGLVVFVIVRLFFPQIDIEGVDKQLLAFANVASVLLAYIMQLMVSKGTHFALKGVPVIGKSFTEEAKTSGVF